MPGNLLSTVEFKVIVLHSAVDKDPQVKMSCITLSNLSYVIFFGISLLFTA